MDIGTAKPTKEERLRVVHHLIDVCELSEQMDVTRYITQARQALADIVRRGRNALIVGGSGFYLKAFFSPVADDVSVDPTLRAKVGALTLDEMLQQLRALNPQGVGKLDIENPRRVSRALERCLASGRTFHELSDEFARRPSAFADWTIKLTRLDREPEDLDRRIEQRVTAMLAAGLVDEVRGLLDRGLRENPSAARAIGYREVIDFIDLKLAASDLASEIVRNTRALVKKQRTWFRTQLPEHRVLQADRLGDVGELFDF
jgi:tRNA dimethylallyltransferase